MPCLVSVLILDGAMPSSVAITADVLATANALSVRAGREPPFAVGLCGSGAEFWRGAFATSPPAAERDCDLLIAPGLGLPDAEQVAQRLAQHDAREGGELVRAALSAGAGIATSCSGVFLFAAAGVLDDRRATTSWWLAPAFRRQHPRVDLVTHELVVRDGPVTTAGASFAQTDLMLSLVASHGGPALADQCARYLLLDERRSQSRYMALGFLAAADEVIVRAEAWARERLADDLTAGDLAAAVGLAPRTFARRLERVTGLSPVRFLQRLRLEAAADLIETTRLSVEEVAARVGYADPSTLRRLMLRDTGLRPRDLRAPAPTRAP